MHFNTGSILFNPATRRIETVAAAEANEANAQRATVAMMMSTPAPAPAPAPVLVVARRRGREEGRRGKARRTLIPGRRISTTHARWTTATPL